MPAHAYRMEGVVAMTINGYNKYTRKLLAEHNLGNLQQRMALKGTIRLACLGIRGKCGANRVTERTKFHPGHMPCLRLLAGRPCCC